MISSIDHVFKGIGRRIDKLFPDNGWLGRLIGETRPDTFESTTGKAASKTSGWYAKLAQKVPLIGKVGDFVKGKYSSFSKIPGIRNLSGFLKVNYFIEAGIGGYNAIKDAVTGFSKTKGGTFSKVLGGIKSGVKSAIKSAGVLAASVFAAVKLPALLGLSSGTLGPAGILVGLFGGMAAGWLAKQGLNKLFDTHGHTQQKGLPEEEINFDVMAQNPISKSIQERFDNRRKYNPYLRDNATNPFLQFKF